MQSALNDVDGAINYIISGEKQHPNRIDICKAKVATTGQSSTPNPTLQAPTTFGQPSLPQAPTPSTFGQPSTFGRPSTSFGQPSQPVASFGQTTTFGKPASTFGQQTPAFGQPAPMGRTVTAFGQPTGTFGQSSAPASTFGQPSNPPAFGKPSNPEAPRTFASQPVPAFPTSTSTFGQQNIPAASTPFGQQAAPPSDTFGQPSQPPPNPFGNPTAPTTTNPFDRPSQPSSSNPFSQPAAPHQPSPFGQTPPPPSNPFTQPPRPSTTDPSSSLPASSTTTKRDAQNKLTLWKGHPVRYIDGEPCRKRTDGAWEKIWFPDGPPKFAKTPELPDELYDEGTRERYLFMRQQGGFRDGVMPLLPPKREWCRWDFWGGGGGWMFGWLVGGRVVFLLLCADLALQGGCWVRMCFLFVRV